MHRNIDSLLELQEIDIELDEVRRILNRIPEQIEEIEQCIAQEEQEIVLLREELGNEEQELLRLKTENSEELARIKGYDRKLKDLKTNREYQAILREIGFAKKVAAETEAEMEAKRLRIKELGAAIEASEEKKAELGSEKVDLEEQGNADNSELSARKSALESGHAKIHKKVSSPVYQRYKLVRRRTADAVVLADSGRCSGCNMALPPQLFNRILRGADLITCPSCYRILYVVRETESA